jgi:hypothetical protein
VPKVIASVYHEINWLLGQVSNKALLRFLPRSQVDIANLQHVYRRASFGKHPYGFMANNVKLPLYNDCPNGYRQTNC